MSYEAIILLITGLLALIGSLIAATATTVVFVNNGFTKNRKLLYEAIDKVTTTILAKLEYHERHDDERFLANERRHQETSDRIWNIELRNAAKDGTLPHEYKKN